MAEIGNQGGAVWRPSKKFSDCFMYIFYVVYVLLINEHSLFFVRLDMIDRVAIVVSLYESIA